MRIVYISHSAVVPTYHTFFSPLAQSPDIDFVLITPEQYKEAGHLTTAYRGDGSYQVVPLPVVFGKSGRQNLHFYKRLYPVLWHLQPDILHLHEEPESLVTLQAISIVRQFPKRPKILLVSWRNLPDYYQLWRRWQIQRYLYPRLTQWTLRRIDHLCTGTREGEAIFRSLGYAGPITYLPHHAVDTKQFFPYSPERRRALKAELLGDPATVAIGYVGRLWSLKGVDLLIRTLAMLRSLPWQAVLVGSGRDEQWLRQMVEEAGLTGRIRFFGACPPERIPEVMNALDVLVLPSRTTKEGKEQFGRVLIEAMACRTAVIGSSSGEIPVVIGDAGLVFPENDHTALAQHLRALVEDEQLRNEIAIKGYHRVRQHFSGEAIAQRIRVLYEQMLSRDHSVKELGGSPGVSLDG